MDYRWYKKNLYFRLYKFWKFIDTKQEENANKLKRWGNRNIYE